MVFMTGPERELVNMEIRKLEIRRLKEEELKMTLDLVWEVFQNEIAPSYTEEGVQEKKEQDEDNIARWLVSIMFGEARWCQSKRYGKIQYSYYDTSLVEPFNDLID